LYTAGGVPVFVTAGKRRSPVSVADGAGGVVHVWQEKRNATCSIVAQRFDGANQPLWPAVTCTESEGSQATPSAISDGAGGVLVTWVDHRTAAPRLFAQRVAADGHRLWGDPGVPVSPEANAFAPMGLVTDGTGGLVACWSDQSPTGDIRGFHLQRVSGDGTVSWPAEGVAIVSGVRELTPPGLASDGSGGAILVWAPRFVSAALLAQRIDGSGTKHWAAGGVPVSPKSSEKSEPVAVPDGEGGAIVVWIDSGPSFTLPYAQAIDSTGATRWPSDGVPLLSGVNFPAQGNLRFVEDADGGAIASWTDSRQLPNNFRQNGIYLQRVDHTGSVRWAPEGVP